MPSSIVVGNSSVLPVTSVGDTVLLGPFYLNNILVAPDIIQRIFYLSVNSPLIILALWNLIHLVFL
jgi:hypothetical protein